MDKNQPTISQLTDKFMASFVKDREALSTEIESLVETSNDGDAEAISTKLDRLSVEIQKLSKSLHDATMFLPSYSVKIRQSEIRELEKALKAKEELLIPKKKFGFKNKRACKTQPPEAVSTDSLEIKEPLSLDTINFENFVTIEKLEKGSVEKYEEDKLNGFDVLVRDLDDITLHLIGSPSTLRLKNVKNCRIICGPVTTSIFVDSVVDSVLFLSCKQLRTHSSTGVDIYLRVLSRAIIEDCDKIRFAPFRWNDTKSEELHLKAEIPHDLERFDAVDDFNWLSASQSPHWSILPESERIEFPDSN